MRENMIFKQNKEVVMTMDKTVTTVTESVETVDSGGNRHLHSGRYMRRVDKNAATDLREAA